MKKTLMRLCMVLFAGILFCACSSGSSDSPYVGTWVGKTAAYLGMEMDVDSIFDGGFTIELKGNGTCELDVSGDKTSGKWTETDDGFSVEDEFNFIVDGDTAVLDYDGIEITFDKE